MKKRGIAIGDMHCGHLAGLTPPEYQDRVYKNSTTKRNKWVNLQQELWERYKGLLKKFAPYDFGLYLGDGVDGSGYRSGGSELIRPDIDDQIDMAVYVCNEVRRHATRNFDWAGVYGTPYHTGVNMDHENRIAKDAGFKKIGSHEWIDINKCIFDIKHHIPVSSIEYSRQTALARERVNNLLWHEENLAPKANIILRAHAHYHRYAGGPGWVSMTIPPLQGMGSKYGARQCSGLVDWGLLVVDVESDGSFDWHAETVTIEAQKAKVIKL